MKLIEICRVPSPICRLRGVVAVVLFAALLLVAPQLLSAQTTTRADWPRWTSPGQAGFSAERLSAAESYWNSIDDDPPLTAAERQAKVMDLLKARSGVYHEAACEAPEMREARTG